MARYRVRVPVEFRHFVEADSHNEAARKVQMVPDGEMEGTGWYIVGELPDDISQPVKKERRIHSLDLKT